MLDWVFDSFIGWLFTNIINAIDIIATDCVYSFSPNLITLQHYFPFLEHVYSTIETVAYFLLIALFVYKIIESLFLAGARTFEHPFILSCRFGLAMILVPILPYLVGNGMKVANEVYWAINTIGVESLDSLTDRFGTTPGADSISGLFSSIGTFLQEQFSNSDMMSVLFPNWEPGENAISTALTQIIVLIMVITIAWNYFKLILELAERYIILGLLFYTMPLACVPIVSQTTSPITKSWLRMYISTLLMLVLNIWFISAFRWTAMNSLLPSYQYTVHGQTVGGVVLWEIIMLSFLKVGQRADAHLAALGFTTAQTGGGVGASILGTLGTMSMIASRGSNSISKAAKAMGVSSPFSNAGPSATTTGAARKASMDTLGSLPRGTNITGSGNFAGMSDAEIRNTLRNGHHTLSGDGDAINYAKRNIPQEVLNGKEITNATINPDGTIQAEYSAGDQTGTLTIAEKMPDSGNWFAMEDGRYMQDSNDSINTGFNENPDFSDDFSSFDGEPVVDGEYNPKVPETTMVDGNYIDNNIDDAEKAVLQDTLSANMEGSLNAESFGISEDGRNILFDENGNPTFEAKPSSDVTDSDTIVAEATGKDGSKISFAALNPQGEYHTVGLDANGANTVGSFNEKERYLDALNNGAILKGTPEAVEAAKAAIPGLDSSDVEIDTATASVDKDKISVRYKSKDPQIGERTATASRQVPGQAPGGSHPVDTNLGKFDVVEKDVHGKFVNGDAPTCFAPTDAARTTMSARPLSGVQAVQAAKSILPGLEQANIIPETAKVDGNKITGFYESTNPNITDKRQFTATKLSGGMEAPSGSRLITGNDGQLYALKEMHEGGAPVRANEPTCIAPAAKSSVPFMPERSHTADIDPQNDMGLYSASVKDWKSLSELKDKISKGDQVADIDLTHGIAILDQFSENVGPRLKAEQINMQENRSKKSSERYMPSPYAENMTKYARQLNNGAPLSTDSLCDFFDNLSDEYRHAFSEAYERNKSSGSQARDIAENQKKDISTPDGASENSINNKT